MKLSNKFIILIFLLREIVFLCDYVIFLTSFDLQKKKGGEQLSIIFD